MDFTGSYRISASPQRVWEAINDPATLKACIPGCEAMDKTSDTDFVATARLKIGPVGATFKGKVHLSDLDPPHSCRLSGEGQGGVAGFAKGEAQVTLTPDGDGTILAYTAKASVGGKLAQIGQRLIDGAAKQIADDFFKRFADAVGTPIIAPEQDTDATLDQIAAEAEAVPEAAPAIVEEPRTGMRPALWVAGLIAVIGILLLVFSLTS
jgi:uncharacterized protein